MAIANLQAQIANLTSLVSQRGWESVSTWGYQAHNQSRSDSFSNAYNSVWSDHSNSMWWEPQQAQQEAWQPYEEFYSMPMQPPQPPPQQFQMNSGLSSDSDTILQLLTSLTQGQQSQAKAMQNRAKKLDELEKQMGEIVEFIGQIQEQCELSNSTFVNSTEDFEIAEASTLESSMEVEDEPQLSKPSQNMDEHLLLEEDEEDKAKASLEEALPQLILVPPPLPQPSKAPMPPNSSKVVPNSIISNLVPPNVPFPCRFMQTKIEEGKKDVLDTLPKIQEGEVAGEYIEFNKEGIGVDHTANALKTPNLAESTLSELVDSAAIFESSLQHIGEPSPPSQIPILINRLFPSLEQAPNQIQVGGKVYMDFRKFNTTIRTDLYPPPFIDPTHGSFEEHVMEDVLEFLSQHTGKPPPQISISFCTNMWLISMIQAPTLEFKPLPDHFNYHPPFKDKGSIVWLYDVKASATWEATHAFNKGRPRKHSNSRFAFLNPSLCCYFVSAMLGCLDVGLFVCLLFV